MDEQKQQAAAWPEVTVAETERLKLVMPGSDMAPAMLEYAVRNRDFHRASTPAPPEGWDTLEYWQTRLKQMFIGFTRGEVFTFVLLPAGGERRILGDVTFSQVVGGALSSAVLGYKLDREAEGEGLMHEALVALIASVFDRLSLHRIEANVRPENLRSLRLLRRLGFTVEGFARDYLKLDGRWHDHVRLARFNPAHRETPPPLDLAKLGVPIPEDL